MKIGSCSPEKAFNSVLYENEMNISSLAQDLSALFWYGATVLKSDGQEIRRRR